jgi:hypothetical protein
LDYGLVSLSIVAWGALLEFLEVAATGARLDRLGAGILMYDGLLRMIVGPGETRKAPG